MPGSGCRLAVNHLLEGRVYRAAGDLVKQFDPAQRIPLKRVGEHQELANLAAYLLSDYSAYVNGEVVTIDGGEWLRNGGEFSHLEGVPNEMWDELEKMRK